MLKEIHNWKEQTPEKTSFSVCQCCNYWERVDAARSRRVI